LTADPQARSSFSKEAPSSKAEHKEAPAMKAALPQHPFLTYWRADSPAIKGERLKYIS